VGIMPVWRGMHLTRWVTEVRKCAVPETLHDS
jgi:hypothetical protein